LRNDRFKALVAKESDGGQSIAIEEITESDLPDADVLVEIEYSSFNYKDGLALKGLNNILRRRPIVPGVDFAGVVAESGSPEFRQGERVVLTGWGVGESWSGGFAERARVKSEWLTKLPDALTTRTAMVIGTAGLTAMLCVIAIERHGIGTGDTVLVSGAGGGVGSVSVILLSRLGYKVDAITGRQELDGFLRSLGATTIIDRKDMAAPGKPLQKERWPGAIDTVGGEVLANILASIAYGGAVAACGLAGGTNLPSTVFPFVLRGVSLLGVDSVRCPADRRIAAWNRLATLLNADDIDALANEVGLGDLPELADHILKGQVKGRTLVNVRI
jgi:acrylyl-CoA reductase (NADPH)